MWTAIATLELETWDPVQEEEEATEVEKALDRPLGAPPPPNYSQSGSASWEEPWKAAVAIPETRTQGGDIELWQGSPACAPLLVPARRQSKHLRQEVKMPEDQPLPTRWDLCASVS